MNWIKKSQKNAVFKPVIVISAIGAAFVGIRIGSKIGKSKYIEDQLGLNAISEGLIQQGRYWIAVSKWTNKRTGKENVLYTGKSESGILVSEYNGTIAFNHQINSGSKINVTKFHKIARTQILQQEREHFN